MKRTLRWVALVLGVLGVLVAGALTYVRFTYPRVPALTHPNVVSDDAKLARGAYLAEHVALCVDCHSKRDFSHFAGPVVPGTFGQGGERFGHEYGFPGDLYAPNITPHALGGWSDAQLLSAITQGVTPDGRALFPFMNYPMYAKLCRADLESIIAYVRALPAAEYEPPATQLDFPVNFIVRTMPEPRALVEACPDPKDTVAHGKYLVESAGCIECHTQREGPSMKMELAYAGGVDFPLPMDAVARSKNITPDETGIGSWTREAFIKRFTDFRDPASTFAVGHGDANTIMPWLMYAGMTDEDLGAIYDFLRTVKPVHLGGPEVAER